MASYWTKYEDTHLMKAIPLYRQRLMHANSTDKVTLEVAIYIQKTIPELQDRTIDSIEKRLPYFENLLAGVFEKSDYAKKDQYLYSFLPRDNEGRIPNPCFTRHKYNGALSQYLKKENQDIA
ncbi:hypothetical protein R4Z10_12350 [Niallia sp. XMNu-256]|uniref:hypothetical protein n=1 Tax=Niallia sp. XMNu-256 TaxID=3082444 RepID=UPI0030D4DB61